MKTINFLLLLSFISCAKERKGEIKKENLSEKYKGIQLTETRSESLENNIKYTLELPDTLRVNHSYDAILEFESEFDAIVEPMVDTINFRTITFYYYNPIQIGVRNKDRDLVVKDSILIPNKKFTLGNVKFKEKGNFIFLALIDDRIMYNFYNDSGKRDSIHYDRKIQEIKKEVVVID